MISVTFTSDVENIVATEHLYQWDNGQKLSISGVGTNADIHFANKKSEKALVVTPTITSGAMVAPIPNSLLADPYPILAYVYVPSDDGARTLKSVTIVVEARKQPSDFVLTEDEGITTIETISQRANAIMANMQTDYNNFKNTIQGQLDDMVANTTVPNANTVGGYSPSEMLIYRGDIVDDCNNATLMGTYNATPSTANTPHSGYWIIAVETAGNGAWIKQIATMCNAASSTIAYQRIYINDTWNLWTNVADGGNANTANTANTAGTLATTPTNVCLRNISFGTAEPQVTDSSAEGYVAPGALYGQYEEVTT